MVDILISELTDYSVSEDGRNTIMNFKVRDGSVASLHVSALELEKIMHELGFVITKCRALSELPKHGIVSMLRPTKARANLLTDDRTVALTFQIQTGLEIHYGFEPKVAMQLSEQLKDAAQQGMKSTPHRGH